MRGGVRMALGVTLALMMGAKEDEPGVPASEILKEQAELASEALQVLKSEVEHGVISPGTPALATWSRRLVEARRASGNPKAYQKALEDHLALMNRNVDFAENQFKAGRITKTDVLDARYALNEARLWLVRDR